MPRWPSCHKVRMVRGSLATRSVELIAHELARVDHITPRRDRRKRAPELIISDFLNRNGAPSSGVRVRGCAAGSSLEAGSGFSVAVRSGAMCLPRVIRAWPAGTRAKSPL